MPLPTAATTGEGAGAEAAEKSARDRGVDAASTATAVPPTSGTVTTGASEPEHVSILSIIASVNASADVRGFALATWRGVENRDGFVLDIERLLALFRLFFLACLSYIRVSALNHYLPLTVYFCKHIIRLS